MHHQLVGRPIGSTLSTPGIPLYDSRVIKIADAIRAGEIEGEIYADGEVWANQQALTGFLARHVPA
jgi:hypothetical protein